MYNLHMHKPEESVREVVERESSAWNNKDVNLLLSIFHPDMVWVWPKSNTSHDPIDWETKLGKFDYSRWSVFYTEFFKKYELVQNDRTIVKIEVSKEGDAAFAVVDIDTLWKDHEGRENQWLGRVCKIYVKNGEEWKLIGHTGALKY